MSVTHQQLPLIDPPKKCNCGEPVTVAQLEVVHLESGQHRIGVFSEFGEVKKGKGGASLNFLKPGLMFKQWLAKCAGCFYGDSLNEEMFCDEPAPEG